MATTVTSAASARRRRCSSHSGKYEPVRSFGIASSIVPARMSQSRRRYPLRVLVRSLLRSPNGAPHTASASAPINASTNVDSISRNRSGLAWASCSDNQPDRSILGGAAIALISSLELFRRNSLRITRWLPHITTPRRSAGLIAHHVSGRNCLALATAAIEALG